MVGSGTRSIQMPFVASFLTRAFIVAVDIAALLARGADYRPPRSCLEKKWESPSRRDATHSHDYLVNAEPHGLKKSAAIHSPRARFEERPRSAPGPARRVRPRQQSERRKSCPASPQAC